MRKVTDRGKLEAILGTPPEIVLMKQMDALDEGCRAVLASSPIAGFGFRDAEARPHTTVIGGLPGFARVESPTRFSFDLSTDGSGPAVGGGVSFVFLVPGVGETLRLNGSVTGRSGAEVAVEMSEAYVHCAKCIRRSKLWEGERQSPGRSNPLGEASGPLADGAVAGFLGSASFAFVSSWDGNGSSDTSPRGDPAGFLRVLDDRTLALPDRKGNKRADTFHNLLTCDQISLVALVPGREELLHVAGTAFVTDEPDLLATMAVKEGERPPKAALIVRVERAEIAANEAVRTSKMWDPTARVDPLLMPDMNRIAAQHIARHGARGATATVARALSKGLAKVPTKLMGRVMDTAYRKDLEDEGY